MNCQIKKLHGHLLEANSAFLRLLGVNTLSQAQDFRLSDIFPHSQDLLQYRSQQGQLHSWEGQLYRADGTTLWVKWSETLTNTDGESFIDGLVEDIIELYFRATGRSGYCCRLSKRSDGSRLQF